MRLDAVRIFVGCDPNDCDLEQMMVLDHSLRQHASLPLDIHWMRLSRDPSSFWYSNPETGEGWRTERWATPFSGFRWAIPAWCNFHGRAIYLDCDIIALADIAELWRTPMSPRAVCVARRDHLFTRFCVMLWDCARARTMLPDTDSLRGRPAAHAQISRRFTQRPDQVQPLDQAFNNIDGEDLPLERIKLLHYSDMATQFSHERAFARMQREGGTHWFDGARFAHPRRDLARLFEHTYEDALAADRRLNHYRAAAPFGPLVKKSGKAYKGNEVTRRRRGFDSNLHWE